MNIKTSVRVYNHQSVLHYFEIIQDKETGATYLGYVERQIGFELEREGFPGNGIVFDFCAVKGIISKCLRSFEKKIMLKSNSSEMTVENKGNIVAVKTSFGDIFEFNKESCVFFCDLNEKSDPFGNYISELIKEELYIYCNGKDINLNISANIIAA